MRFNTSGMCQYIYTQFVSLGFHSIGTNEWYILLCIITRSFGIPIAVVGLCEVPYPYPYLYRTQIRMREVR